MDSADQVAIHEAMEQQTISVTKAGIQATLNARTSILAAANPVFGRYDKTKTLRQNVAISAPIMSRFDLFFVVLDELDEITDDAIARHIVSVHQRKEEALSDVPYTMETLQNYIKYARTFTPVISPDAKTAITRCYQRLRENDVVGASASSYRITVRQLESMIRLSEALARMHLDNDVKARYVVEAYTLLKKSVIRVETQDVAFDDDEELAELLDHEDAAEAAALADAQAGGDPNADELQHAGGANGYSEDVSMGNTEDHASASERAAAAAAGVAGSSGSGAGPNAGESGADASEDAGGNFGDGSQKKKKKKKLQLTYAEYQVMKQAFALRLQQQETAVNAALQEAASADGSAVVRRAAAADFSMRVGDLIAWYLESQELQTAEELKSKRTLCRKVIQRLIDVDNVLYYTQDAAEVAALAEDDRLVALNPDYSVDGSIAV